jgi:pyruvate formate lyase activating enzyme
LVSSYNEPLITSEWSVAIFQQALKAGLRCAYVSNGNATSEVLAYLRPYLSAYKVDLKTMQDKQYRKLGGVLQNVLDTIQAAHDLGLWVEVVTLVVPGFNDSPEELWDAARFLASVSPDIPWHVTAYHPDYRMDVGHTTADSLRTAVDVGQEAGLRYVYAGNLPGKVGSSEHTFCPSCAKPVIRRSGFVVQEYLLTGEGNCPSCGTPIPGIWPERPETVRTGRSGWPRPMRL